MRAITSDQELVSLSVRLRDFLNIEVSLPDMVMNERYGSFHFMTSDEILAPIFFNHMKKYLSELNERSMFVVGLGDSGVIYSAIEVLNTDTEDEYLSAVNSFQDSTSIEMHASKILLVFSGSGNWFVYGDKEYEISICGFLDNEKSQFFKRIYSIDLIENLDLAADYAFSDLEAESKTFMRVYA